ncbi:MAG: cytochrome c biogenesis protein ResB [Nitrospirae bacterium]|nr:cytochrome c biogenesis protein ResB [Nitrospirota bacterium]
MLYRLFSSLKTSVYILAVMCLVFIIGTIFPQGRDIEDYIKAGGKYVSVVSAMDFLDVFVSPLFIFVAGMLLINLAVCLYDRLRIFLRIKRKPIDFSELKANPKVVVIESADIDEQLKKAGFKLKAEGEGGPVKIFEKGLQYWWLSWFYHVGIILAILGFFLTALFAFEKDIILSQGKPETISLYSKETKWNKYLEKAGMKIPGEKKSDEYVLTLKEFKTEYYQGLKFDYPKGAAERFKVGVGVKKIEPAKKDFSYMPKLWLTHLDVKKPDGQILDAKLWVNKPFRTGGLTLYQMGYEQKVKLSVNGKPLDVEARVPFEVKGVKGNFVLGTLKLGTLYKKDGTKENIIPQASVYYMPEKNQSQKDDLGTLILGKNLKGKNVNFKMKDYKETSALSYRNDPGVWLVGLACLFVFIGLFVRSLGAWYRVQCSVEGNKSYLLISTRGILADRERIIRRLQVSA